MWQQQTGTVRIPIAVGKVGQEWRGNVVPSGDAADRALDQISVTRRTKVEAVGALTEDITEHVQHAREDRLLVFHDDGTLTVCGRSYGAVEQVRYRDGTRTASTVSEWASVRDAAHAACEHYGPGTIVR